MSRIGTMLAVEVHGRVIWIIRSPARFLTLALEALKRGSGFDQRAIDREVLVREQSECLRLRDKLPKEFAGDLVRQQSVAIGSEARMIEARLVQLQVQKPAEQQIVVELLTELRSLRIVYSAISSEALSRRSGGIDGRPNTL